MDVTSENMGGILTSEHQPEKDPVDRNVLVETGEDSEKQVEENKKLEKISGKPDYNKDEYNYLRNSGFSSEIFKIEGKYKSYLQKRVFKF